MLATTIPDYAAKRLHPGYNFWLKLLALTLERGNPHNFFYNNTSENNKLLAGLTLDQQFKTANWALPEPGSLALFGIGALAAFVARRKRRV